MSIGSTTFAGLTAATSSHPNTYTDQGTGQASTLCLRCGLRIRQTLVCTLKRLADNTNLKAECAVVVKCRHLVNALSVFHIHTSGKPPPVYSAEEGSRLFKPNNVYCYYNMQPCWAIILRNSLCTSGLVDDVMSAHRQGTMHAQSNSLGGNTGSEVWCLVLTVASKLKDFSKSQAKYMYTLKSVHTSGKLQHKDVITTDHWH